MPSSQRIISLLPSATEIVAALGCQHELVGRSHECDFPPGVERLPVCSESKFATDGSSGEIDALVKTTLAEEVSIYRLLEDVIDALAPTVVITQSQCDVCAVSLADVQRAIAQQLRSRPDVVALEPMCLADVWQDIARLGKALRANDRAAVLLADLQARLKRLAEKVPATNPPPHVACIEWIEPLMAAGNWVPELVALAGGQCLFGQPGRHSPWIVWEDLRAADPEVILVMPCGFDLARTLSEMAPLIKQPGWSELKAVQSGQVFLVDGHQYFNRPGPRLVDSAEIVAEILHPAAFNFGHAGQAFVRWQDVSSPASKTCRCGG